MTLQALLICAIALVPTVSGEVDCSSGGLIPHPTKCQGYYNCSMSPIPEHRALEKYEYECPYPDLFDYNKKKCMSYKEADCGPATRLEEKDPCKYILNTCGSAHCEGCAWREPSCVGLTDGLHKHPLKTPSYQYMVCENGRRIDLKTCGVHSMTGTNKIFDNVAKACLPIWEVRSEDGGTPPSCDGKAANKMYLVEGRSNVFHDCPDGQVYYCGLDKVFVEASQACE